MIYGLSGRPGSGKSYEAVVTHIIPALKDGRKVITNIPLNVQWFVDVFGRHMLDLIVVVDGGFHNYGNSRFFSDAEDFLQFKDWRNDKNQSVYFVVDECHLVMGKITPSEFMPEERIERLQQQKKLKEYLSMHRHYGHDILILTQNFRKVDPDIRDMVSTCYFTTKLSMLGQDHKYVCKVAEGVSRNIVATHEREYQKKYFSAYKSHTQSDGSVEEAKTADVRPWWQNKFFAIAGLLFLFLIYLINSLFTQIDEQDQAKQKVLAKPSTPAVSAPAVSTTPVSTPVVSTPSVSVVQNQPEKKISKSHPYSGLQFHIAGFAADYNNRGYYQKVIYISVSRNGQRLTDITNADLSLAGYTWTLLNDCMLEISYRDVYQDYVFCDSPTQSVQFTDKTASLSSKG